MPGRRSACSSRRRLDRTGRWRHGRRSTRALRPSGSGNSARAGSTERVVRDFGNQLDVVSEAQRRLAALTKSGRSDMSALMLRRAMTGLSSLAWLGALSRNGRAITYMDGDGRVVLADSASGERIRTLLEPDDAIVPGLVAISPDASSMSPSGKWPTVSRSWRCLDAARRPPVLRLGAGDAVSLLEWPMPDRILCRIDSADGSASVRFVDTSRNTSRELLHLSRGSTRLALSQDATLLAFDQPGSPGRSHAMSSLPRYLAARSHAWSRTARSLRGLPRATTCCS